MKAETIMSVAAVLLSATALWDFIKFIITRKDQKQASNNDLRRMIEQIGEKVDRNQAILARTHILRFDDELLNNIKHSKEYFAQQLQDIDTYELYCTNHPDFKNSYAVSAINHIRSTYSQLLEDHKL